MSPLCFHKPQPFPRIDSSAVSWKP
jgi:hypothetical protein